MSATWKMTSHPMARYTRAETHFGWRSRRKHSATMPTAAMTQTATPSWKPPSPARVMNANGA